MRDVKHLLGSFLGTFLTVCFVDRSTGQKLQGDWLQKCEHSAPSLNFVELPFEVLDGDLMIG